MSSPPFKLTDELLATMDAVYDAISPSDIQFLKAQASLEDDDILKRHVLAVRDKALQTYPYPCILRLSFVQPRISRSPVYQHALRFAKEHSDAILLDMGCCSGVDVRKAVADGYPVHNVIATDLRVEFWDLGHALFKSTPATFPVHFIAGDALDPSYLPIYPIVYSDSESSTTSSVPLNSLTSLTPLGGRVSLIYASSFFHLFSKEQQTHLAYALAGLLSCKTGSMIFGQHIGMKKEGLRPLTKMTMFCHSPQSWRELWDGGVFRAGEVAVQARLETVEAGLPGFSENAVELMIWSVTRL